jgi:hypothetical protein
VPVPCGASTGLKKNRAGLGSGRSWGVPVGRGCHDTHSHGGSGPSQGDGAEARNLAGTGTGKPEPQRTTSGQLARPVCTARDAGTRPRRPGTHGRTPSAATPSHPHAPHGGYPPEGALLARTLLGAWAATSVESSPGPRMDPRRSPRRADPKSQHALAGFTRMLSLSLSEPTSGAC